MEVPSRDDPGLDFRVLGPVEVRDASGPLALGGPRQRAVLAMLVLAAPEVVTTDRIVDGLWGEQLPRGPLQTVQVFVHNLRKALRAAAPERALIVSRPPGYVLTVTADGTDVGRFTAGVERARVLRSEGRPADAAGVLEEALALWRGEALADVRETPFAEAEAVRLDELRLSAREEAFDLALQLGRHAAVLPALEEQVAAHPMRERFWGQLMVALYRSDRQAEALAAYGRARDRLADELGIDPSEALRQLELAVLRQDPRLAAPEPAVSASSAEGPPAPRARRSGRVPEVLTTTHGRDELVRSVLGAVRDEATRLVTLTGSGGSGKSRVAAVTASRAAPSYPGGVWWLTATEATDARQLALEVVHLLTGSDAPDDDPFGALDPAVQLPAALVVLDDLEALDDAAPVVRGLIERAPHVTVLVTSRVPLRLREEHVVPVDPLEVPPASRPMSDPESRESPSVALFLDRWTAGRPVQVGEDQLADVAELCRFLDGSPLALELAAARAKLLSPRAVLAALREGLSLLSTRAPDSPERHRTLEAVVQWSYDRLEPAARTVCDRLALFERGFTVEAVEAVCADVPDVLDALTQLLDARFIRSVESRVDVRLALLGTVRSFTRQRLAALSDVDAVHERLARHLLRQVQESACDLDGPDCALTLARFDDDAADVAAAHDWSVDRRRSDLAGELACASHDFWISSGRPHDGLGLLTRTLALPGLGALERAKLHAAAGTTAYHLTDWDRTRTECRAALELVDDTSSSDEERETAVTALTYLAGASAVTGSAEEAAEQAERALRTARELGLYPLEAVALSMRAIAAAVAGDFETERRTYEERLEVVGAHGDDARVADTLNTLAEIALDEADVETARAYGEESLRMAGAVLKLEARDAHISLARADVLAGDLASAAERLRDALALSDSTRQSLALAQSLRVGGCLAQASGEPEKAVRLFAAAQRLSPSPSGRDEPAEQDLAQALAAAREALGDRAHARQWALGTRLPLQSARETLEEVLARVAAPVDVPLS